MPDSEYIDLRSFLQLVRGRWLTVVLVMVLTVALATAFTLTRTKQYSATAILLAGQGQGIANVQDVSYVNQVTTSLARMTTDRIVVQQALTAMGDKSSPLEVSQQISSSVPTNTQEIELTVTDPKPERAAALANGIATTFSQLVKAKSGATSDLSATVWQPALVPGAPSSPNVKLNIVLALVLGLLAGIGAALLRNYLDTRWTNVREIEDMLGAPILALIPEIGAPASREKVYA